MSSSSPAQFDPPHKLIDFFTWTSHLHPVLCEFYTKYWDRQHHDIIGVPVLHVTDVVHGNRVATVGHSPIRINIGAMVRPRSIEWEGRQYPSSVALCTFQFDSSNCGVCHFHYVNSLGQKGMGTAVLALIETIANFTRKKYITCSISNPQREIGIAKWLEKSHYVQKDSFVGGNSGHTCYLYTKDLVANPNHQIIWKPKEEPAK